MSASQAERRGFESRLPLHPEFLGSRQLRDPLVIYATILWWGCLMPRWYGSHADYMLWVKSDADHRQAIVEEALRRAFSDSIERRNVDVIVFSGMTAASFAQAIFSHPLILKPAYVARGNERYNNSPSAH